MVLSSCPLQSWLGKDWSKHMSPVACFHRHSVNIIKACFLEVLLQKWNSPSKCFRFGEVVLAFLFKNQFAFLPPLANSSGLQSREADPEQQKQNLFSTAHCYMANYRHFQLQLHTEVSFVRLQRTTAFTLPEDTVLLPSLHMRVYAEFLLTREILSSSSRRNWRAHYEWKNPAWA